MITINGKSYSGRSVIINNDQVIVDGVLQTDGFGDVKEIKVDAKGFAGILVIEGNATIKGNIDGQVQTRGSLSCKNIFGDVSAGGSINCEDIDGDANAGGSVNCNCIGGEVKAGGSINRS
ncbi:hypothetical protein [Bacillus subtilis]|uniref:hypothetical protein n=1 Tax=Bacillus subtilis TaxID=1423 RepID=UPI002DB8ECE5|nr:hypothetical protein [Bacillus subtilis]MEC2335199.1 hypothetical protein [Bacillus subtilis]